MFDVAELQKRTQSSHFAGGMACSKYNTEVVSAYSTSHRSLQRHYDQLRRVHDVRASQNFTTVTPFAMSRAALIRARFELTHAGSNYIVRI